ncbi:MAG: hypothetical protein SVT56_12015 [Chloroflexota bacterium]|jgi:hypothetical protein|nr:hypothetical protein [Chloroflexota bacterium]
MPSKNHQKRIEETGRKFAKMLYELPIRKLVEPKKTDLEQWRKEFHQLDKTAFDNILKQTQEARLYHQERVGWQAIPHDLTVILFVIGTIFFGLKTGIIIGIAALVFFESLFQFIFIRKLYKPLSLLVWLTYPAYFALAYYLFRQGYQWYWILLAVVGASLGIFFLGQLARIPMHLIMEAKQEAEKKKSEIAQD